MALSKLKRQTIVDSLLSEIGRDEYFRGFSIKDFAKTHGLSPQSVYRYLSILESENKVTKKREGKRNRYQLVDSAYYFVFPVTGISEDVVWNQSIKPLLADLPEIAFKNCNYAFTEMLNNAIDHSEGTHIDISISINAFRVSILIADNGVGIFTKIADAMKFEEKRFAVLELAKGKFTTAPDSHTGEGIFFSAKAVDLFTILSDDLIFTSSSFEEKESELLFDYRERISGGTIVSFDIFRDHSTTVSELFDRYTNEPDHYGFSKTRVPVKLLEFGDPDPIFVSRSQAKRLLVRFERFEKIELDFNGIDEIGQGFADEVFRVFQKQHPDSEIVAVNCSPKVERMIRRVTS